MRQTANQKRQEITAHEPNTPSRLMVADAFTRTGPDEIMDRYLAGNLHERLNLWLTHREMRSVLSALDGTQREP